MLQKPGWPAIQAVGLLPRAVVRERRGVLLLPGTWLVRVSKWV